MILHQFVHRPLHLSFLTSAFCFCTFLAFRSLLSGVQPAHQPLPIRLNDFGSAIVDELLYEDQHSRSQRPGLSLRTLDSRIAAMMSPGKYFIVVRPGGDEESLKMLQAQQITEEE